jgi:hypothetical protein
MNRVAIFTNLSDRKKSKLKSWLNDFRTQLTAQYLRAPIDHPSKHEALVLLEDIAAIKADPAYAMTLLDQYVACPLVIRMTSAVATIDDCVFLMQASRIAMAHTAETEIDQLALNRVTATYFYAGIAAAVLVEEKEYDCRNSDR